MQMFIEFNVIISIIISEKLCVSVCVKFAHA